MGLTENMFSSSGRVSKID